MVRRIYPFGLAETGATHLSLYTDPTAKLFGKLKAGAKALLQWWKKKAPLPVYSG